MADRDYIICKRCNSKMIDDGEATARNSLESMYGDESKECWTVELLCPDCIKKYENAMIELIVGVEKGEIKIMKKKSGQLI